MAGAVEAAIRATLQTGHRLETLGRNASAVLGSIDETGVTLLMGYKRVKTPVTWSCLEGVPMFLVGRDWVQMTGPYDPAASAGTLASFLESKRCKATAALVGALLEAAGVVEVERAGRISVRLERSMSPARSSKPPAPSQGTAIAGPGRRMVETPRRPHPEH